MQKRAHRFRVKQKKEIAQLKMVAQGQDVPKEEIEEVTTPYLGKRVQEQSSEDKIEEMKRKIQKLQEELQKKDNNRQIVYYLEKKNIDEQK